MTVLFYPFILRIFVCMHKLPINDVFLLLTLVLSLAIYAIPFLEQRNRSISSKSDGSRWRSIEEKSPIETTKILIPGNYTLSDLAWDIERASIKICPIVSIVQIPMADGP